MLIPIATRWHTENSTASYSMKLSEANIQRKMLGLAVKSNSFKWLVLILPRLLGNNIHNTREAVAL